MLQAPFGDTVEGGAEMFVAPFTMPSIWLLQKSERDKRKKIYMKGKHRRMSNSAIVTSTSRIQGQEGFQSWTVASPSNRTRVA